MKYLKLLLSFLILFLAQVNHAQNVDLQRAKRCFNRTFYSLAIPMYEEAFKEKQNAEIVGNLADAYFYNNNLINAKKYYTILIKNFNQNLSEDYFFRYIQTLKATGDYTLADKIAKQILSKSKEAGLLENFELEKHELENISAIGNRFDIKNLALNTKNTEFGPFVYNDSLVFAGLAISNQQKGKKYKWNNEHYLSLLIISLKSIKAGDSVTKEFSKEIDTKMHESNAVFTKNGKTMYFTRNNFIKGRRGKNKQKISNLQIFKASLINDKWTNVFSLPINSENYSNEHPALSVDEKTLYFSSDMPGTLGSFDLYAVQINDGKFGIPKNLGGKINTSQKEQFPFVASDNKLYFSSNGHFGYGSLDVFVAEITTDGFSKPQNVGLPVNSGYDDFGFSIDPVTKEGFFSSNRLSGKGSDDIYELKETKLLIIEDCKQFFEGIITDIDTKLPLENAVVVLESDLKVAIEKTVTSTDGKFKFKVACERDYTIRASKENYHNNFRTFLLNKERNKITDAAMALKSDKEILKEAQNLAEINKREAETKAKQDKTDKINRLIAQEKDVIKDKNRLIIKTEPIYFDYDLWYIRKESKPILNRVIELMKKYPTMIVESGSHTDVRGNNNYNLVLSSKRAASTRDYFLANGVPANRISAKGYGETVPIIKCEPDNSCIEEQHELNRRSEFVIKDL